MKSIAQEVKEIIQDFDGTLEVAGGLADVVEQAMEKLEDKLPADRVAKIMSLMGKYLGASLKPISTALAGASDRWLEKNAEFIKKQAGVEKLSEETALALVAIRSIQIRQWGDNLKAGMDSNKKSK